MTTIIYMCHSHSSACKKNMESRRKGSTTLVWFSAYGLQTCFLYAIMSCQPFQDSFGVQGDLHSSSFCGSQWSPTIHMFYSSLLFFTACRHWRIEDFEGFSIYVLSAVQRPPALLRSVERFLQAVGCPVGKVRGKKTWFARTSLGNYVNGLRKSGKLTLNWLGQWLVVMSCHECRSLSSCCAFFHLWLHNWGSQAI